MKINVAAALSFGIVLSGPYALAGLRPPFWRRLP
jgi:hypothetical protein